MAMRGLIVMLAVAASSLVAAAGDVVAQTSPLGTGGQPSAVLGPSPRGRTRIEIYPAPLLHRRCVDWYELQYRPSGTVLYPQMRCQWVRG